MSDAECTTLDSLPQRANRAIAAVSLWVPAGLALGVAAALGFARFAYSLLLPAMQSDLHWTYAQAGSLGTAMAAGYLLGSLVTASVERAVGTSRAFRGGLVVTALSLLAMALFRNYPVMLVLRFITGLVTSWVFIAGYSLAARAGAAVDRSTLFTAVYAAGAGLGMVLSGLLLPPALASGWGWPAGWLLLGALTLIVVVLTLPAVRRIPHTDSVASGGASGSLRGLRPVLFAYLAYGAGYFALMTFVITYLRTAGYGHARIVDFWIIAGIAASLSMLLGGPLLARLRGSGGVALTTGVLIASALVLLMMRGRIALIVSALLFGGSLMASAFAHLDYARELVPPQAWTRVIAAMTVMFSFGQAVGPALCGWIADSGGLRAGMFAAIGLLLLCIASAALQRDESSSTRGQEKSTGCPPQAAAQEIAMPASAHVDTHPTQD